MMVVVKDGGVMVSRALTRKLISGDVTRLWQLVHPAPLFGRAPGEVRAPWSDGDRWWLREFCRAERDAEDCCGVSYQADRTFVPLQGPAGTAPADWSALRRAKAAIWDRWVHPMAMPRWAARFEVTVVEVHLERLQALNAEDIAGAGIRYAEGQRGWTRDGQMYSPTARQAFARWWDSEHPIRDGGRVWVGNPWVWRGVVRVERLKSQVESQESEVAGEIWY